MHLFVDGTIVRVDFTVGIHMLNVTARLAASVSVLVEGKPVLDGTAEPTDVDEVEEVRLVGPFLVVVVDLETDVGRNPAGLDGRDVGADDVAVGERIGEVDCPETYMSVSISTCIKDDH